MTKKYTHAYLPGNYYAAVRFANKIIRESGWFNKAIETSANYYDVDEDELKKYVVRWKQECTAAQKAKGQTTGGWHFKWFIVVQGSTTEASGYATPIWSTKIKKSKSIKILKNKLSESDMNWDIRKDYGGSYAPISYSYVWHEGFNSKEEAEAQLEKIQLPTSVFKDKNSGWE